MQTLEDYKMKSLLIAMSFVIASSSFGRTVMYSVDTKKAHNDKSKRGKQ
tara:strand:- start:442 stop:588 length:147 start_codon:yes stop_codon:yes gene_type:complete